MVSFSVWAIGAISFMQIAQHTIIHIVFWNLIIIGSTGFTVFQFSDQKKCCFIFMKKIQLVMEYRYLIVMSNASSWSHKTNIQLILYILYIVAKMLYIPLCFLYLWIKIRLYGEESWFGRIC